jgi:Xaa-Pro aminopeptidase
VVVTRVTAPSRRDHVGEIPISELVRRWDAVRAYLHGHDASALVVSASQDYLGGSYRWLTDRAAQYDYGAAAVFHVDAPMTLIEHGDLGAVRELAGHPEYPGVGLVRTTAAFHSAAFTHGYEADLIIRDLRENGCRRVAVAGLGAMPYRTGEALRNAGLELLDATEWLDGVKAIKSDAEMIAVRAVAALQDEVFARTLTRIGPGMLESDVRAEVQAQAARLGSDQGVILTASAALGQGAYPRYSYFQERRLQAGDYLMLLVEVNGRSGYYCELGRIVSLGPAPAQVRDGVAVSRELQAAVLRDIRPGVSAAEVAHRHDETLAAASLRPERRLFAHGQGYDLVERPLIRADETMTLAAGMNLACHPGKAGPDLFTFVCDNHLVTDTGVEPLHLTEQQVFEV